MLVAGLDIGNATTEVVLATAHGGLLQLVARSHARTTGRKGSPQSARGARRVLEAAEREAGAAADLVAVCELFPVDTLTVAIPRRSPERSPIRTLTQGLSQTPAGVGVASGGHVPLATLDGATPGEGPIIASVPAGVDFELAARRLGRALERGWEIVGVIVAGDDAVLIHNRLAIRELPIVDEVTLEGLATGAPVVLEVAGHGETVRTVSDPVALVRRLGLGAEQLPAASAAARELAGRRVAAVTVAGTERALAAAPVPASAGVLRVRDRGQLRAIPLDQSLAEAVAGLRPGSARSITLDRSVGGQRAIDVSDVCVPDVSAVDDAAWLRRGIAAFDRVPLAISCASPPPPPEALGKELGRPVVVAGSEAHAAARGARSTPSVPPGAAVLDIGAGTIDLVGTARSVSAAGGGALLTAVVAQALGIPRALAEQAKRGPAVQVAGPHVAHREDGSRYFLTPPAPGTAIGSLALDGEAGLTPFATGLAAEEWRALRHALKSQVIGANVRRCLDALEEEVSVLLVAGGGALDHEVVEMIGEHLRGDGVIVARADVAGRYGPRFAVAWGAALTATTGAARAVA